MVSPIYQEEGFKIYCGDARTILPQFAVRADVTLTDPPYDAQTHAGARSGAFETLQGIDFAPIDAKWVAPLLLSVTRRWILAFCSLQQLGSYRDAAGDAWIRAGTWLKTDGAPQFTGDRPAQGCDGIAILHGADRRLAWNGGGAKAHWEYGVCREHRVHPTQKPEELMAKLVTLFSDPGETVLDPFLGSGTTLVAAKRLGRKGIGVELNPEYCALAVRRLQETEREQLLTFDDEVPSQSGLGF